MSENLNLNQPNQLDPEDHEALTQQLDFEGFKGLVDQYGLDGATPQDRLKALKGATSEDIALFLTDLNRQLQGESQTQIHNETMSVGESKTISPQDRFDLFNYAIDKIKNTDDETNPARVGDTLALTVLLLHPFKDGNGRVSRTLALLYRDEYDDSDAKETFDFLTESRDVARERIKETGGVVATGYIPRMREGSDQSNPADVRGYIDDLLSKNDEYLYVSPAGEVAPLKVTSNQG